MAVFAFRSLNAACAQAWLDIHTDMRRRLERIESGGQLIWNGRAQILARKANAAEAAMWSKLSDEAADGDQIQEPDYITVWLIPTSGGSEPIRAFKTNKPSPKGRL
ncbi:MAG: hypothetical protein ACOYB4_10260 [Methyloceanibacter sp.]